MRSLGSLFGVIFISIATLAISSCSSYHVSGSGYSRHADSYDKKFHRADYASRIPKHIKTNEKKIVIYPKQHVWGAYDSSGKLVKAGLATAGGKWCKDINRGCKTPAGSFRIKSLGSASCKSSRYPLPNGGAAMPYCMFFNGNIGLHGSKYVFEGNGSHGCIRLSVRDAEWVRFNFAKIGTKVVVKPY